MSDRYSDRPFPPADRNYANRGQQQDEGDPLAELARLIGQTDPYSSFGRSQTASAQQPHDEAPAYEEAPAPQQYSSSQYSAEPYSHAQYEGEPQSYANEPPPLPSWMRPRDPAPAEPAYSQPAHENYSYPLPDETREQTYNRHTGYRLGYEVSQFESPQQQGYADDGQAYGQQGYGQDGYGQGAQGQYGQNAYQQGAYDSNAYDQQGRYDQVLYGAAPRERGEAPYAGGYDQGYYEDGYNETYAPEPERHRRRGGFATVAAVLALAVLGTAGAYAYRSIVGSPRSGEPPVIKADASPNKIVPANQSAENKQIYDRVGDKSAERMVSREEQPVEVDARSGGPRVVFPPLTQNPSPPSGASVSPAVRPTGPGVANGTMSGEAPRRIRTVSIRPDQPDMTSQTASAAPVAPAPTPVQSAPARAPAAPSNAPVALAPQPAHEPAQSRVAALAPAPAAAGSYVQLSSQRSEADAMTSYRVLQGKYPGILGSRQATVRRADLGSKGVYYRALVGPFASTDEATQFCVNLQSAGGKCIVQRN